MDYDHYLEKLKEHEQNRTSTNDRNAYWTAYHKQKQEEQDYKQKAPPTRATFEHG